MKALFVKLLMVLTAFSFETAQCVNQVLVKEILEANTPSVQYVVFDQHAIIHHFSQGNADIEDDQQVEDQTSYNLYSITKTFTALAILQLAEQGKVDLHASVKEYLPDTPIASTVTVKHLLSHSSGISDPIPLSWIHLAEDSSFNADTFFQPILQKHSVPKCNAGERFKYSNLGYVLLGHVVARVSGMPYEKYVAQHIISPLDLAPGVLGFRIADADKHAVGYHKRWSFTNFMLSFFIDKSQYMHESVGAWKPFKPLYVNGAAYGGLIGTTGGLVKYLQEFLKSESRIVSPASKALMFTETLTNSNKPTGMCLSWFSGTLNGQSYFTHAGGGGGYYVEMRLYPEQGIGSLIIFNRSGMSDQRFLDRVDKFFIHGKQ